MRPAKLTQEQIIQKCALCFKQHGYHGTSMQMLAEACGLSKGAFYYYYRNKQDLISDILNSLHQHLATTVFAIAEQKQRSSLQRFQEMHHYAKIFFSQGEKGCLMAIISIEALYAMPALLAPIQQFFADWQTAMLHLYTAHYPPVEAERLAKMAIADYEGAILMFRLNRDLDYIDLIEQRFIQQLSVPLYTATTP
ncbi:TetR/AcrR family transcriptional regulator [Acinetobacter larvae]|uniref:TetR family transcriptional regulator n=1 Tax=Acinetobacter larvae TaxID=1789224 RepID=A0A1B2M161_9GAMM|nr:TetR/AcrR family transcriptional regulator [Acinetobacter larvae]AOA58936.1 TetR family transcriptional regulator [Acinetobacter larvae]